MKWIWQYLKSAGYGKDLPNFSKVAAHLYRGGKPSEDGYFKLFGTQYYISTVINLIDGNQSEEDILAKDAGLNWVHIPMSDKEAPSNESIESFFSVLELKKGNVFVHCEGGRHRTGLVIAVFRVVSQGWDKEKGWKEAEKFGWYSALGHEPLKTWFFETFKPEDFKREY